MSNFKPGYSWQQGFLDIHCVSHYTVARKDSPMPKAALKAVNLRVREDVRAIIDQAAQAQGRSRSDFMIDAARRAAEEALIDQAVLRVDRATYDAFVAALDAPAAPNERLTKTMRRPALWDPQ
jgi:uncharacterized protein (DUF1778 family)